MQTRINDLSETFEKVSLILERSSELKEIAPFILQELGTRLNCRWGTYWKVFPDSRELRALVTWTGAGFEATALKKDTKDRALSLSEGTAGHVRSFMML